MTKLKVVMALLLIGMLITGGLLVFYAKGYYDDRKEADSIREIAYGTTSEDVPSGAETQEESATSLEEEEISIDFASIQGINSETVGWLRACGGEIDGPVVQTTDNNFYLGHKFDKSSGSVGCFFADANLPKAFESQLTVIYGHNRKDGSMFHPLLKYKDKEYFETYPTFDVYTENGKVTYRVCSAYYADNSVVFGETFSQACSEDATQALDTLFEEAKELSLHQVPENLELSDIVILSTCEYSGNNNRMVIYGIRE